MIVDLLLTIFYGFFWVVLAPIRALSDVVATQSFLDVINPIKDAFASVSQYLPISDLFIIIALIVAIEGANILLRSILFIIKLVRG